VQDALHGSFARDNVAFGQRFSHFAELIANRREPSRARTTVFNVLRIFTSSDLWGSRLSVWLLCYPRERAVRNRCLGAYSGFTHRTDATARPLVTFPAAHPMAEIEHLAIRCHAGRRCRALAHVCSCG
jgi:hypothetical protein